MRVIGEYFSEIEARVAAHRLEAAGIEARLEGIELTTAGSVFEFGRGAMIRLVVQDEDAERAGAALVAVAEPPDPELASGLTKERRRRRAIALFALTIGFLPLVLALLVHLVRMLRR